MKNSLSKCEKAVLEFFQNSSFSQISYTGLSDYTGFTRRAVIFAIQNLIEKNILTKERGVSSNEYHLSFFTAWKLDKTARQVRRNRIRARRRAVGLASAKRTGAALFNCSEKDINVQMYRPPKHGDFGHWWVSRNDNNEKVMVKCYPMGDNRGLGTINKDMVVRSTTNNLNKEQSFLLSKKVLTIKDIVNTSIAGSDWNNIISLIDKYVKQETDAVMLPHGITPYMRSWVGDKIEGYSELYWKYFYGLKKLIMEAMVGVKRAKAKSKSRCRMADNGKAQKKLST